MTTRALLLALVLVGAGSGSARGQEHVGVVFYTATAVVERHDLLFLARPDQDWVFAGR